MQNVDFSPFNIGVQKRFYLEKALIFVLAYGLGLMYIYHFLKEALKTEGFLSHLIKGP